MKINDSGFILYFGENMFLTLYYYFLRHSVISEMLVKNVEIDV